ERSRARAGPRRVGGIPGNEIHLVPVARQLGLRQADLFGEVPSGLHRYLHLKAIDYAAPKTVAEAVALVAEKGDRAGILAGGTDILVQVREGRRDLDLLVDVKHIPEANELTLDAKQGLLLGAAVPCYRI